MNRPSPEIVGCPSCGVKNFAIDDVCAECGKSLEIVILPRPTVRHVGLGSVMVVIAVLAVCLAPVRYAPGLSMVLAMFLVPGALRGVLVLERRRLDGRASDGVEVLAVLLRSFFVCFAIALSGWIAFVVFCFPIGLATMDMGWGSGFFVALCAGAIAGLLTLCYVGKKLWPEKD